MNHVKIASPTRADVYMFEQIAEFLSRVPVSTLLHRCGVGKRYGYCSGGAVSLDRGQIFISGKLP